MKHPDSIKNKLFSCIDELTQNPANYALNPGKDFSRNRKISFPSLVTLLLSMEDDCLKEELYHFFGRTEEAPSRTAFYNQRRKIHPGFFQKLLYSFNQKLDTSLYHDKYQLVACDGSSLDFFRNPNDPDTYYESNGKSVEGYNQVHVNAMYSILDRRFLDLEIQPARKKNEYSAFCSMVDRIGNTEHPIIYTCDRGYASYNDYAHVIEHNQFFLIRCTDAKTSKLLGFPLDDVRELDYHVDRILNRTLSKAKRQHPELSESYRYICSDVPFDYVNDEVMEYHIHLRVVRLEIAPNCFENLITNLPDIEFDFNELKLLYHYRWKEEIAFRDIKYSLCLKAFHSKKYEYVLQEIWARAILHSFCSAIIQSVSLVQKKTKHIYQVNFSQGCKICRDFLRRNKEMNVEDLIAQNTGAIRQDRIFARQHRFKLPFRFCYR